MTVFPEPPLTPKAVATRARLLDLAAQLFIERGYAAVSLRDIAREADLTKGAIYGHFRSKGQLLVEVIRTRLADADAKFDAELAAAEPDLLHEQFIHPGSRDLRLLQLDAAAAARHDPDVAAGIAELHRLRDKRIVESVAALEQAEAMAFVINVLASGVAVQEAYGRPVPDGDEWTRLLATMFDAVFRADRRDRPTRDDP